MTMTTMFLVRISMSCCLNEKFICEIGTLVNDGRIILFRDYRDRIEYIRTRVRVLFHHQSVFYVRNYTAVAIKCRRGIATIYSYVEHAKVDSAEPRVRSAKYINQLFL